MQINTSGFGVVIIIRFENRQIVTGVCEPQPFKCSHVFHEAVNEVTFLEEM